MKARNLTVLAVVATGAIAFAAPAAFAQGPDVSGVDGGISKLSTIGKSAKKQARAAKSKSLQRVDNDIKRLGNNVHDLRKKDDEITFTISNIVGTVTPILTQLGAAAESYADFQYGFVQLGFTGVPSAAGGPTPQTFFMVTPRLDPTGAQSTVSKQFAVPDYSGAGWSSGVLQLRTGVRSLNDPQELDNKSTAMCNAIVSRTSAGAAVATTVRASKPNADLPAASRLPYYPIQRSPYEAATAAEELPSLVGEISTDKITDLAASSRSDGTLTNAAIGDILTVTLSCTAIPNSNLKDAGITPPFAQ